MAQKLSTLWNRFRTIWCTGLHGPLVIADTQSRNGAPFWDRSPDMTEIIRNEQNLPVFRSRNAGIRPLMEM